MTDPAEKTVLAVDGGNSKTDVALVSGDGTLLALARGPGLPGLVSDETVAVIGDTVASAIKLAALDGGSSFLADHLFACVANADFPAEEQRLTEMLAAQRWAAQTEVANDTFAVLRAGLDDVPAAGADRIWGVGITCGTGMNGVGIGPDGRTARFLGLGTITGDWGGGGTIGLDSLWHAARAADGRGPATLLAQLVPAHFGLADPLEVAEALHFGRVGGDELAGLAPVVFQAADQGDEVAAGIVSRLAEEIFLMAKSTITRLGLITQPDQAAQQIPVVIGGGIAAAGHRLLIGRATSLITAEFPHAEVRVLSEAPVAGASLLGLDRAGASPQAKRRLRAAFQATTSPGPEPEIASPAG